MKGHCACEATGLSSHAIAHPSGRAPETYARMKELLAVTR